jgi:iron complex transport system substrate-binding protein
MHRTKHTIFFFLLACSIIGVVACRPAKPQPSTAAPAGDPIIVTDAAGRTVELAAIPRRIIVMGRGPYMALHLLYMFPEGPERLVAWEKKGMSNNEFLSIIDPAFDDKPTLESGPGPEQIAALDPDLVIMKSVTVEQMSESLAEVGIPVVYVGLETPEQFYQDVTNLGILLGNEARAEEIITFYTSRIERIQQAIAGIGEDERPRVLVLEYSDRGSEVAVQVPAQSWMQTIQAQTAGGSPVWLEAAEMTDGWTVVNFEQIAVWDPDKIFIVVWYTLDPAEVIASLKADPQWSKLRAVQNDQVYAFPSDIYGWDTPEPRWILGMTWLATRIYPDRFADVDVTEEMVQFFGQMYGMDQEAVDAYILPGARLDVH